MQQAHNKNWQGVDVPTTPKRVSNDLKCLKCTINLSLKWENITKSDHKEIREG